MVRHGFLEPPRRLPGDHTTMSLLRAAALTVLTLLLNACGGGGAGGGSTPPATPSPPPPPALATLSGVLAEGQALGNTVVSLHSAEGTELTRSTTGADGAYTLRIPSTAAAPLELRGAGLRALLPQIPSAGGSATAHINPITEAVRASLAESSPTTLSALTTAGNAFLEQALGPVPYGRFASDPAFRARNADQGGSAADVLLDALAVLPNH